MAQMVLLEDTKLFKTLVVMEKRQSGLIDSYLLRKQKLFPER